MLRVKNKRNEQIKRKRFNGRSSLYRIRLTSSSIYKSLPFLPRRVFGWLVTEGASDKSVKSTKSWRGRADHRQTLDEVRPENRSDSPSKYLPSLILGKSQFRPGAEFRPDLTTSRETQRVNYIFHVQIFSSGYNPVERASVTK